LLQQEETAAQSELEALTIRYGGDLQAAQERNRAALARFEGRSALTNSAFRAGSSLLGAYGDYRTIQEKKEK